MDQNRVENQVDEGTLQIHLTNASTGIPVMDKGRLVECGNHTELLAAGGLYCKLYSLQTEESN